MKSLVNIQKQSLLVLLTSALVLVACQSSMSKSTSVNKVSEAVMTKSAFETGQAAPVRQKLAMTRATEAQARLSTTDAGKILLKSIEHHGGLQNWYALGTTEFSFEYKPVACLLYTSPSPRDRTRSRMPSSA